MFRGSSIFCVASALRPFLLFGNSAILRLGKGGTGTAPRLNATRQTRRQARCPSRFLPSRIVGGIQPSFRDAETKLENGTCSQHFLVVFPLTKSLLDCPFCLLCGRIRKVLRSRGLDKENRMVKKIFFRPYFQNRLIWAKVLSKPFARNHLRNQEAQTTSLSPRD